MTHWQGVAQLTPRSQGDFQGGGELYMTGQQERNMNRFASGWMAGLAALALNFGAAAALPERAPLEARLNLRGDAVSTSLSTDSRLVIGQCAECEQLRLRGWARRPSMS